VTSISYSLTCSVLGFPTHPYNHYAALVLFLESVNEVSSLKLTGLYRSVGLLRNFGVLINLFFADLRGNLEWPITLVSLG
jgi:hypothetical protein